MGAALRRPPLLLRLLWLALPTLVVLGGAEIVLRHLLRHEWPWGLVRDDNEAGWALTPGWSGRYHGADVAISDLGLRDPRSRAQLRAGPPPIYVLGDSVVMGYGVAEADSLPRRLEALLPGVPVINAGVLGYGTEQEAILLDRLRAEAPPRAVVVGFCLNDILSAEHFRFRTGERGAAARLSEWLRAHSALYHALRKRLHRAMVGASIIEEHQQTALPLLDMEKRLIADPEGTLRENRAGLERIAQVERDDVPVVLAVIPYREQMAGDATTLPQARIQEVARPLGIRCVDLLPALRGGGGERLFLDSVHLTGDGAAAAARAIAPALLRFPAPRRHAQDHGSPSFPERRRVP